MNGNCGGKIVVYGRRWMTNYLGMCRASGGQRGHLLSLTLDWESV